MTLDLHPGADRLAALVRAVPDGALAGATPCADYAVGDLLDHISGFAVNLGAVGRRDPVATEPPGPGRAAKLGSDWRERIASEVQGLAAAWDDPAAYEGMTTFPFEMPAAQVAVIGLEELCVHGWDLARSIGQPFEATAAELDVIDEFFTLFGDGLRGTAYGPAVPADGGDRLASAIAFSGRDPAWTP